MSSVCANDFVCRLKLATPIKQERISNSYTTSLEYVVLRGIEYKFSGHLAVAITTTKPGVSGSSDIKFNI